MFSFVMNIVDLGSIKKKNNTEDFDYDKYPEPVENAKRNIIIERIQTALFAIPCIMFVLLMFLDFRKWEVSIICIAPMIIAICIDFLKDKEAQCRYDDYSSWELELEELQEEYDD